MSLFEIIILGIVEGLTEFLPVSSTGHMILVSAALGFHETEFLKTFEISIQIGAILAIVFLYYERLLQGMTIYYKLAAAFVPTGVLGFFAYKTIKSLLFNPLVVSISLILGGVVLIVVDKWVEKRASAHSDLEEIPWKNALAIGFLQSISMIPGVSRAAATIIGGVLNGFDKKQAMEFSFLLALPTMAAATAYDLLKSASAIQSEELMTLSLGLAIAFVSAFFAVKGFVKYVERFGFRHFGYYRIVIGLLFLLLVQEF